MKPQKNEPAPFVWTPADPESTLADYGALESIRPVLKPGAAE